MTLPRSLPPAAWALLLAAVVAFILPVHADTFDDLRARWFDYLTGSNAYAYPFTDPDVQRAVTAISDDANAVWNKRVTGSFTDRIITDLDLGDGGVIPSEADQSYDVFTAYDAHYNLNKTYARLRSLALAYAMQGTTLYQDPAVRDFVISALDWLYAHKYMPGLYTTNTPTAGLPDSPMSFWWKISIPQDIEDICVLMYPDITANGTDFTHLANYMASVGDYMKKHAVEDSGANRVWECRTVALHGILLKQTDSHPTDYTPYAQTDTTDVFGDLIPDLRYARNHLNYESPAGTPASSAVYSLFAYVDDTGVNLEDPAAKLSGFYRDGSFIQHNHHPYTGGYGASLIYDLAHLLALLHGTSWAVNETSNPGSSHVFDWVYDSYEPLIYRGAIADSVRGREISRSDKYDHTNGHTVMAALIRLVDVAPADTAADIKAMIKYWIQADTRTPTGDEVAGLTFYEDAGVPAIMTAKTWMADAAITPRLELLGHYAFPAMDRIMHRRPGFGFGLSMYSNLVYNYESLAPSSTSQNLENKRGWFTGDGMTTLYTADVGQFSDVYWPTIDAARLPGTTVDTLVRQPASSPRILSPNDWVGGAALDYFGVAGMDFKAADETVYNATTGAYDTVATVSLVAKKSWFMFDNEIACLGAGITSSDGRTIETIVENRRLDDPGTNSFQFAGSGSVPASPVAEGSAPATLTGVTSAALTGNAGESIGYYFPAEVYPSGATLKALRETRTHSWNEINDNGSTTAYARNYLTLWLDHGPSPTNATYGYVLLPGCDAAAAASYAASPDVAVTDNSPTVQAVKEKPHGITAANFWSDGVHTTTAGTGTDGLTITADKKAAVIVDDNPPGWLEVAVSDPTRVNTAGVNVTLNTPALSLLSADPGVSVSQLSPAVGLSVATSGAHGHSFRARLLTGSPVLIDDDFDPDAVGAPPSGWTSTLNSAGTISVAATTNSVDRVVTLDDTSSSGAPTLTRSITAQNSPVTVEFDVQPHQTTGLLEIGSLYDGGVQAAGVYLRGDGQIAYYDGSGSIHDSGVTYAANTWYHFRITARPDARRFDIEVNGAVLASGVSFRNDAAVIDTVRFGGTTSLTGAMDLNNVIVRQELSDLVADSFDATAVGTLSSGWTASGQDATATVGVQPKPWTASDDRGLRIADNSTATGLAATRSFAAQSTAFVTEFRIAPMQSNQRITIALNDGASDCVLVYFHENGTIRYYDGATLETSSAYVASTNSAPAPYDVRIAADPVTGRFDLYVNDARIAAQAAFHNPASAGLQALRFVTLQAATGVSAYVDHVRIYH